MKNPLKTILNEVGVGLCAMAFVLFAFTIAEAKDLKVHVKGMVCGFCSQGIQKQFEERSEVKDVNVSLKEKTVTLSFADGQNLPDEEIKSLLEKAGYGVENIERAE